jgi:D-glycero-alpha-D-manno-heptose-7-phosphate kinase
MELSHYLVAAAASLRDALTKINANHNGAVFLQDPQGSVIGASTDGDIRRYLISGGTLDDPVSCCVNPDFLWGTHAEPREQLLKKLDQRIRVLPILNKAMQLVDVISRDHIPLTLEGPVYARSMAPVRVSFGGGGSDLTHYFAEGNDGAVINATISLYSHATLRLREDTKVIIHSLDLDKTIQADSLADALVIPGPFGLIQALLKTVDPTFGFELFLHSDFPMKSGLGGSAVIAAAVLGCFNQFRRDRWDLHELSEIAYQAERLYLGVAGGWQDQYATVFGGFNFMEFRMNQNIVHPLRVQADTLLELEESLILCDTGSTHNSNEIHISQQKQMEKSHILKMVEESVRLSYEMRNAILRGKLLGFGQMLDQAWQLKRQFSEKISDPRLDKIYTQAQRNGAVGGKLLGAGGGGFFLFYVPAFKRHDLMKHLVSVGLTPRPFRFESRGLQAWSVRESNETPR